MNKPQMTVISNPVGLLGNTDGMQNVLLRPANLPDRTTASSDLIMHNLTIPNAFVNKCLSFKKKKKINLSFFSGDC